MRISKLLVFRKITWPLSHLTSHRGIMINHQTVFQYFYCMLKCLTLTVGCPLHFLTDWSNQQLSTGICHQITNWILNRCILFMLETCISITYITGWNILGYQQYHHAIQLVHLSVCSYKRDWDEVSHRQQ